MAGNVTVIRSAGQVVYRLAGDAACPAGQVGYRLGLQGDARAVLWIGSGATARACGVSAGQVLGDGDEARVAALMAGLNPATGEVLVVPKVAAAESAKLPVVPLLDAVVLRAAEHGLADPALLLGRGRRGGDLRGELAALQRLAVRGGDAARVRVDRLERLARAAGVDPAAVYGAAAWSAAWERRGEQVTVGAMGYDVRLTLPKGASLAVLTAGQERREQLLAIARQCAVDTYQALGERVGYGAAGHHGGGRTAERVPGGGIVGTATMEATSRDGDPHLHFHSLIANLTVCEDGKARTIGSGGLDVMAHGAWASERFAADFRARTAAAGLLAWGWNEATGEYDAAGVSAEARAAASKRRAAILAHLGGRPAAAGRAGRRAADARAERVTRAAKEERPEGLAAVEARCRAGLAAAGVPLHGPDGLVEAPQRGWGEQEWADGLGGALTEHRAAFTRVAAEAAALRMLPPDREPQRAEELVARWLERPGGGAVAGRPTGAGRRLTGGDRWTTEEMLRVEDRALRAVADGIGAARWTMTAEQAELACSAWQAAERRTLNDGQRAMLRAWLCGGNAVEPVIGAAGTGKTAAADAARFAWEAAGLRVLGISTAGIAAANLGAEAGIEARTAASLAAAIGAGRAPAVDVLVWDEMGMAGARELAVILPWAAANGVDVRGMGDPKQLDSVAAGSLYGRVCDAVGAVELTRNMRQRQAHERAAVEQLRHGRAAAALGGYAAAGQVAVAASGRDRVAAMASAWARDAAAASTPLGRLSASAMIAGTNAAVEDLGRAAREEARARGWLTGPDVVYRGPRGEHAWAVGDLVTARRTVAAGAPGGGQGPRLRNGQRAVVEAIDAGTRTMTLRWTAPDGRQVLGTVAAGYVAEHIRSGVAITNHAAQGQTIDRVHVDLSGMDRNGAYVAATRSRERLVVHTDLDALDADHHERRAWRAMDGPARAAWAAARIGGDLDRRGWSSTDTAHDTAGRPDPLPPAPAPPDRPLRGTAGHDLARMHERARAVRDAAADPGRTAAALHGAARDAGLDLDLAGRLAAAGTALRAAADTDRRTARTARAAAADAAADLDLVRRLAGDLASLRRRDVRRPPRRPHRAGPGPRRPRRPVPAHRPPAAVRRRRLAGRRDRRTAPAPAAAADPRRAGRRRRPGRRRRAAPAPARPRPRRRPRRPGPARRGPAARRRPPRRRRRGRPGLAGRRRPARRAGVLLRNVSPAAIERVSDASYRSF